MVPFAGVKKSGKARWAQACQALAIAPCQPMTVVCAGRAWGPPRARRRRRTPRRRRVPLRRPPSSSPAPVSVQSLETPVVLAPAGAGGVLHFALRQVPHARPWHHATTYLESLEMRATGTGSALWRRPRAGTAASVFARACARSTPTDIRRGTLPLAVMRRSRPRSAPAQPAVCAAREVLFLAYVPDSSSSEPRAVVGVDIHRSAAPSATLFLHRIVALSVATSFALLVRCRKP